MPTGKSYFYTVSKDLSAGGVKILTNEFIPKGNLLKVNINLIDDIVDLRAKVAWCNKDGRYNERYSTGLEFTEINALSKKTLTKFLNKIYNA
jgi:c-di-GMP-binding flagellar brake protein YcgR